MALDTRTLSRLSQNELDEARRGLSEALCDEAAAEAARRDAEAAIIAETSRAARSTSDIDVERFASWLKHGRSRLAAAEATLAEAVSATAYKRAVLALARIAAAEYPISAPSHYMDGSSPDSGDS